MRKHLTVWALGILILVAMVGVAWSQTATEEEETKDIRIGPGRGSSFKIDFKANKQVYKVDEPISFRVKSNKTAYVYLFYISERK